MNGVEDGPNSNTEPLPETRETDVNVQFDTGGDEKE